MKVLIHRFDPLDRDIFGSWLLLPINQPRSERSAELSKCATIGGMDARIGTTSTM
jgi:hypothetical protein